jgi:hypothetical protein
MAFYRGIETTAPTSSIGPDLASKRGSGPAVPTLIVYGPTARGISTVPDEPGGVLPR